jgi:hypothetical protein
VSAVILLIVAKTRKFAPQVFYIPLCALLISSSMLFPPLSGGAGLYRIVGFRPAVIIGCALGVLTGAWLGIEIAGLSGRIGIKCQLITPVLLIYACFIPLGLFEDLMGGGSGYGDGLPRWFMKLLEIAYRPWMGYVYRLWTASGVYCVASIVFWLITLWCGYAVLHRILQKEPNHLAPPIETR